MWSQVPLRALLQAAGSGTWGQEPNGPDETYPVLRSTNIRDGRLTFDDVAFRSVPEEIAERYMLREDDILVTTSSGSSQLLGKNAIVESLPPQWPRCLFSNFTWRLRPNPSLVHPRFVYFYLNSRSARAELQRIQSTTSGLRNLNTTLYLDQPVPLAPLSEQRRIFEILDQGERLRRLRGEADAKADRILPALLTKVLGPVSDWDLHPKSRPLGELVEFISGGTPSKKDGRLWSGEIPWVSPKDMKHDFIRDTEDHVSVAAVDETGLRTIQAESVLLVVRGMILARSVPVALNLTPVTINQDMKGLVPKVAEITGRYLWAASYLARTRLLALVRTAAHGTRKLDTPDLLGVRIVVPSAEQRCLVEDAVRAREFSLEKQRHAQRHMSQLFSTLLRRAFAGTLTASWRQAHMKELLQEMEQQGRALEGGSEPRR